MIKLNKTVNILCMIKQLSKYGITPGEYIDMLLDQDKRCAICNTRDYLVIDHCHATGKVRGLLCNKCNLGLGLFKDNVDSLQNAIKYLT